MESLDRDLIARILGETRPSFQLTDPESLNLGFGWLYYGFVRALRPRRVLAIGSKRGFAPVCLALGLRHNGGHTISSIGCYKTEQAEIGSEPLIFVDPSKSRDRQDTDHSWGEGFWDDPSESVRWFGTFGCSVHHEKLDSDEFFRKNEQSFDLVLLDGSHTYDQTRRDLSNASASLNPGGLILMHDVDASVDLIDTTFGSSHAFVEFADPRFLKTAIPIFPGLGIIFDTRSRLGIAIDPT